MGGGSGGQTEEKTGGTVRVDADVKESKREREQGGKDDDESVESEKQRSHNCFVCLTMVVAT